MGDGWELAWPHLIQLILLLFLALIHYVHIKEFKLQVELLKVRFATGLRKDC
jgi:hypothetical protein